jgi:hypothetical protein
MAMCGHDDCAVSDEMAQECAAGTSDAEAWECEPTTFSRAARAWCAAVAVVAGPYYPEMFAGLLYRLWVHADPNPEQLVALHVEAARRADWVMPGREEHMIQPKRPGLWHHRTQYGLVWTSSVDTWLIRDARGWRVRIVGQHEQRRRAAEEALVS